MTKFYLHQHLKPIVILLVLLVIAGCAGMTTAIKDTAMGDPLFDKKNTVQTFIITSHLIGLATEQFALGIDSANIALGIKDDGIKDFLTRLQAARKNPSYLSQVADQSTQFILESEDKVKKIKDKMLNGDYKLSEDAVKKLEKADEFLQLASFLQTKATVGGARLSKKFPKIDLKTEFVSLTQKTELGLSLEYLTKFPETVSSYVQNFRSAISVVKTIHETKDITNVKIAKKDVIENAGFKYIDNNIPDLDKFADQDSDSKEKNSDKKDSGFGSFFKKE